MGFLFSLEKLPARIGKGREWFKAAFIAGEAG
jgi:hypothetical protein